MELTRTKASELGLPMLLEHLDQLRNESVMISDQCRKHLVQRRPDKLECNRSTPI